MDMKLNNRLVMENIESSISIQETWENNMILPIYKKVRQLYR